MMDKYAFAGFSIPFVAVAVMHFDRNILSDALVRSIFYCKSNYNYFSAYLDISLALTAGLRLKSSSYVSHELRQESEPAPPIQAGPQQKKTGYVHTVKWSGEGDGIHHRRLVYRGSAKLESPGASQSPNQSLSDLGGG